MLLCDKSRDIRGLLQLHVGAEALLLGVPGDINAAVVWVQLWLMVLLLGCGFDSVICCGTAVTSMLAKLLQQEVVLLLFRV